MTSWNESLTEPVGINHLARATSVVRAFFLPAGQRHFALTERTGEANSGASRGPLKYNA